MMVASKCWRWFVLATLWILVKADETPECQKHTSRYDALACWLSKLVLELPDQSFRSGIIHLKVTSMQCSQFTIDGVNSSTSVWNATLPALDVSVATISAICTAQYSASGLGGNLLAKIGESDRKSALDWSLALNASSDNPAHAEFPHSVESLGCQTALDVVDLKFTGSMSAKLVDLFRKTIAGYVSQAINEQICPVLERQVVPALNDALQQVADYLDPYLVNTTAADEDQVESMQSTGQERTRTTSWMLRRDQEAPSPALPSNLVDFPSDAPFLVGTLSLLNNLADTFLNRGLLRHWFPDVDCDSDCGVIFDGVNGVIGALLEPTQGRLLVPIPPGLDHIPIVIPGYAKIDLQIRAMVLTGVDDWSTLQLLEPVREREFASRLATAARPTLSTEIVLNITEMPGGLFVGDPLVESVEIQINASHVDASATVEFGVDAGAFGTLKVGTIIDAIVGLVLPPANNASNHDLQCIMQAIQVLQATDIASRLRLTDVGFEPVGKQQDMLGGNLERDLDHMVNTVLQLFLHNYPKYVSAAILGLSRGPLRDVINDAVQQFVLDPWHNVQTDCSAASLIPGDENTEDWINFYDFDILHQLNDLLRAPYTIERINEFLECGADFLSRALRETLPPFGTNVLGSLSARLRELVIVNGGSLLQMRVLSPDQDGTCLQSGLEFGSNGSLRQPQLFTAIEVSYPPLNLSASVNMTMTVDDVRLLAGSLLQYDLNQLKRMDLSQLLSHWECAAAPAYKLNWSNFEGNLGFFGLVANATIDNGSAEGPTYFSIDSQQFPSVRAMASSVMYWMVNSTRDVIGSVALSTLNRANQECNHRRKEKDGDGTNYTSLFVIVTAVFLLTQPALLLIRNSRDNDVNESRVDLRQPLLPDQMPPDALLDDPSAEETRKQTPLIQSDKVSKTVRHVIPIAILLTVVLLLSSNLGIGATVDLKAHWEDRALSLPALFEFSLLNTARDMFNARIYPLFLLVVLFSGVWPYMKLVMLLYAFVTCTKKFSVQERGRLLLSLDALGKFSLVDTYVLVLMMVAFRYHLDVADSVLLDVYVSPHFGFYGFLAATGISLLIGHVLVFYHRRAEIHLPEEAAAPSALRAHEYRVDESTRALSLRFQLLAFLALLTVTALLGVGITRESFVFEFGGLAGKALQDDGRKAYSLLSLGLALPTSVEHPWSFGLVALQIVYFFYSVVMPFACLLSLLVLFACPLTLHHQLALLTVAEITNAWSAIEVFVLSVVAALLEISTFAQFIIGHRCDLINQILKEYFGDDDQGTCYTVHASVAPSSTFLIVGVLGYSWLVSRLLRLAHLAVDECVAGSARVDRLAPASPTVVQRYANTSWTRWILAKRDDDDSEQSAGPPRNGGEKVACPWQNRHEFEDEWQDAAERDPAWKEWKDATNVT